jgi:hypothetical protein
MLTYENFTGGVRVLLNGKRTGEIRAAPGGGYRYQPKGSKVFGDTFATIEEVKASLN